MTMLDKDGKKIENKSETRISNPAPASTKSKPVEEKKGE